MNLSFNPSPLLSIYEKALLVNSTSQILKNDLGKEYINHCPFKSEIHIQVLSYGNKSLKTCRKD